MKPEVRVIGAGLAGCEAAVFLARRGIVTELWDIKPAAMSPAHNSGDFAELVCSNSLKSNGLDNACGLLKEEMRRLGALMTEVAAQCAVPAGQALAVDRDAFAAGMTQRVKDEKNIVLRCGEVTDIDTGCPVVVAAGPMATPGLLNAAARLTGRDSLYFYDAAAPIVAGDSIDLSHTFVMDRYDKGTGDYLNCPLDKAEYDRFIDALCAAQTHPLKQFEDVKVFEGCMPVETLAKRGRDALRYGPLKPKGLRGADGRMPYAVLQLRRENTAGSCYNLVGCQTNLTFSEQRRVFSFVPALKSAEYLRYGVMHRNAYIDAPRCIDRFFRSLSRPSVFFAGQLSGVEGYVESAASGLMCGIHMLRVLQGKTPLPFPETTVLGALSAYLTAENKHFQPMNANFGLLPPLSGKPPREKRERYLAYAARALDDLADWMHNSAFAGI